MLFDWITVIEEVIANDLFYAAKGLGILRSNAENSPHICG